LLRSLAFEKDVLTHGPEEALLSVRGRACSIMRPRPPSTPSHEGLVAVGFTSGSTCVNGATRDGVPRTRHIDRRPKTSRRTGARRPGTTTIRLHTAMVFGHTATDDAQPDRIANVDTHDGRGGAIPPESPRPVVSPKVVGTLVLRAGCSHGSTPWRAARTPRSRRRSNSRSGRSSRRSSGREGHSASR
jgi:hypothetical protein